MLLARRAFTFCVSRPPASKIRKSRAGRFSAGLAGPTPGALFCGEGIPKRWINSMICTARFRNVLVHLYWEVDNRRVVQHTRTRLEFVESYLKEIGKKIQ